MFFDGWQGALRTVVLAALSHPILLCVRCAGKRASAKLNAFDPVVTVALGSTLATIVLGKDVTLVEGVLALATLIALPYAVAWVGVRSRLMRAITRSEPTLPLRDGVLLPAAMRRERITASEVRAAVRAAHIASLAEVAAVVFETDGSLSVIPRRPCDRSALADVVSGGQDGGSWSAGAPAPQAPRVGAVVRAGRAGPASGRRRRTRGRGRRGHRAGGWRGRRARRGSSAAAGSSSGRP